MCDYLLDRFIVAGTLNKRLIVIDQNFKTVVKTIALQFVPKHVRAFGNYLLTSDLETNFQLMKIHIDPDSDELVVETPMRMQAHGQISATALGQQYIVLGLKSGVV